MYLMIGTRPDIAFAIGKLSKFCDSPKVRHWTAVKRIFRYLSGTRTHGLCFDGCGNVDAYGYSGADWACDMNDRKSTSAYTFLMCNAC